MRLKTWQALAISPYRLRAHRLALRTRRSVHLQRDFLQVDPAHQVVEPSRHCSPRHIHATQYLTLSVVVFVTLTYSKSRVCLRRDLHPVRFSETRSARFPIRTVLIGRRDFDTIFSIPDFTLSCTRVHRHVDDVASDISQALPSSSCASGS